MLNFVKKKRLHVNRYLLLLYFIEYEIIFDGKLFPFICKLTVTFKEEQN